MPLESRTFSSVPKDDTVGGVSYTHIIGTFARVPESGHTRNQSPSSQQKRGQIGLKTHVGFESYFTNIASGLYQSTAGCSLADIFYPFETATTSGYGSMCHFHVNMPISGSQSGYGPNGFNLLPMKWVPSESGYIYDINRTASGNMDAMSDLVNGDMYVGQTNRYRDISRIRGIALRLPAMGVGWGYDIYANPFPSGVDPANPISGVAFKNGLLDGKSLDPIEYVAAPIDLRYDPRNHVWTSPKGFWAEIVASSGIDVVNDQGARTFQSYSWVEKVMRQDGSLVKPSGYKTGRTNAKDQAYEINNNPDVASGTHVWMFTRDRNDNFAFTHGGGDLPAGTTQYQVLSMTADSVRGWDYPRSHP